MCKCVFIRIEAGVPVCVHMCVSLYCMCVSVCVCKVWYAWVNVSTGMCAHLCDCVCICVSSQVCSPSHFFVSPCTSYLSS